MDKEVHREAQLMASEIALDYLAIIQKTKYYSASD